MNALAQPTTADLFPISDELRALKERKEDLKATLKEVENDIKTVERQLSDLMADAECPSFTRNGKMFVLTTASHWSAEPDRKDALYSALRGNGYNHLFTVHSQTLASFLQNVIDDTEGENGEKHIPDWLCGLIKSYDAVSVTMRSSAKKSK